MVSLSFPASSNPASSAWGCSGRPRADVRCRRRLGFRRLFSKVLKAWFSKIPQVSPRLEEDGSLLYCQKNSLFPRIGWRRRWGCFGESSCCTLQYRCGRYGGVCPAWIFSTSRKCSIIRRLRMLGLDDLVRPIQRLDLVCRCRF